MTIKVYAVSKVVEERELNAKQIANIRKLFNFLMGEKRSHLSVKCILPSESQSEDSILFEFKNFNPKDNFNFRKFADKLLEAETNEDGKRNATIRTGFLFLEQIGSSIKLIKLESTNAIDPETFAIRKDLGLDNSYYKICIFKNDFNNVTIIDKSNTAAKFWYNKFLDLKLFRDSDSNTDTLIKFINKNLLFSDEVKNQENYEEVKDLSLEYIFESSSFDKTDLMNKLVQASLLGMNDESKIFSEKSLDLDSEFVISKKMIVRHFKKSLPISDITTIYTDNIIEMRDRQEVEYNIDTGKLELDVQERYRSQILQSLGIDE
ncbi:hypothetical protein [Streptococcus acidominimus]|uniref:Nucleoid-associated protein n=1 Tax=Streptococcus acidominimus TaxID=1326 RepID=A0A1Q8ECM3_STRAI|nr:hypothetical protein [Streptococcus acidominimus]OLF49541.1 hypothetical protein BU200_06810 [Streptococcus acidominimus]SUN07085.1 Uncharacterised protein [Streptococcus acidominimus]